MFEETAKAIDTVSEEKERIIKSMSEMDKDKLSLFELKTYVEILEILSRIKIDSYFNKLTDLIGNMNYSGIPKNTIGEVKEGK